MSKEQVQPKTLSETRVVFVAHSLQSEMEKLIDTKGQPKEASDKLKEVCRKHIGTLVALARRLN